MREYITKILAVDPGMKKIGIAISDETSTIARPLCVFPHRGFEEDAAQIAKLANENCVTLILVGGSFNEYGIETPSMRHAKKFASSIKNISKLEVIIYDEWGSTIAAQKISFDHGLSRKNRGGHQDANAAAVLLQSYLDEIYEKKK